MRVFISVDIEGIAGVAATEDCFEGRQHYRRAVALMRGEAEAAALGALDGGASEVVVRDAHGSAFNLAADGWPAGVRLVNGWSDRGGYDMVEGLDDGFDALAFVGYHGGSGADRGVLAHTMSSSKIRELRIGGRRANEAVMMALRAGDMGVPVVFLAGDSSAVAEVGGWLPGVVTVTAKQGLGYECGLHRRPEDVRDEVRSALAQALAAPRPAPLRLDGPTALSVTFNGRRSAEVASMLPGSELDYEAGAVHTTVGTGLELCRTVELWLRLGGSVGA